MSFVCIAEQWAGESARLTSSCYDLCTYCRAVGLGESGRLYVGVNLEFARLPLNNSVHAEQFLVVNALHHGETGITKMAVSAAPCGHCRQFYSELCCAVGSLLKAWSYMTVFLTVVIVLSVNYYHCCCCCCCCCCCLPPEYHIMYQPAICPSGCTKALILLSQCGLGGCLHPLHLDSTWTEGCYEVGCMECVLPNMKKLYIPAQPPAKLYLAFGISCQLSGFDTTGPGSSVSG